MYLKVTDGVVTYPYTLRQLKKDNPNTSFPSKPSLQTLSSYGVFPVTVTKPEHTESQYLLENAPAQVNGVWTVTYSVNDYSEEQLEAKAEQKATRLRNERDAELERTDWYAIRAYETGVSMPTEWSTYRTALRDITSHEDFPDVSLPVAPDYVDPTEDFPEIRPALEG